MYVNFKDIFTLTKEALFMYLLFNVSAWLCAAYFVFFVVAVIVDYKQQQKEYDKLYELVNKAQNTLMDNNEFGGNA